MDEALLSGSSPPSLVSAQPVGMSASLLKLRTMPSTSHSPICVTGLPERDAYELAILATAAIHSLPGAQATNSATVTVNVAQPFAPLAGLALPVALAYLRHTGAIPVEATDGWLISGELGLGGVVHATRGVLAMAEAALAAGLRNLMVPTANAAEAAAVQGLNVVPVTSLRQAVAALMAPSQSTTLIPSHWTRPVYPPLDFRDVPGHEATKRGLTIAAAGGHAALLRGPCGSGKVLLARRFTGLLPPLSEVQAREATKLYSLTGLLPEGVGLLTQRPFRSPHHTISAAGLVGGGVFSRPGEASLAHNGVLLLDELPEFRRTVLEGLDLPLRESVIHLARSGQAVSFPACFHLLGTMNSCPCGHARDGRCRCTQDAVRGYHSRVPPLLAERFDVTLDVPSPLPVGAAEASTSSSADCQSLVLAALERQAHRYASTPGVTRNAQLPASLLSRFCPLTPTASTLLAEALHSRHQGARPPHHRRRALRLLPRAPPDAQHGRSRPS